MTDIHEITDPVENMVAIGLIDAGIEFIHDNPCETNRLDFYLPEHDIYIECKRFHSDRIAEQMSRGKNVIAIQGMAAAEFFSIAIGENK